MSDNNFSGAVTGAVGGFLTWVLDLKIKLHFLNFPQYLPDPGKLVASMIGAAVCAVVGFYVQRFLKKIHE